MRIFDIEAASEIIKERSSGTAKWDCGSLLIVAGSSGMAGAAVLCGCGAVRSGAGLITFSAPDEIIPILQTAVPEVMCVERKDTAPSPKYDCAAFGPGLGDHREDAELIAAFLRGSEGGMVIDADGLNDIVRYDLHKELAASKADIVLTPHLGEAARLLGIERAEDRNECAMRIAEKYNVTALVKGPGTAVCSTSGDLTVNTSGNAGLATAGSGDVLTGIIASLMAQGIPGADAARAGAFIHGLAGDMCAEKIGMTGMSSSDLPIFAALAVKQITDYKKE